MYAVRHSLIFYTFIASSFVVIVLSIGLYGFVKNELAESDGSVQVDSGSGAYFSGLEYFLIENITPSFFLKASELISDRDNKKMTFFYPTGTVFTEDKREVNYTGKSGFLDQNTRTLTLGGDVQMSSVDSLLKSENMKYWSDKDFLICEKSVWGRYDMAKTGDSVIIESDKLRAYPKGKRFFYSGNAKGEIKRKLRYEENIKFGAENIDLFVNEMTAKLVDNVLIIRGNSRANSRSGEIFLENYNKKLKYYTMSDDVRVDDFVIDSAGKKINRKAFSEKLDGIVSEDKVILTGYPKVFQDKDVVKGNKIIIRDNNETIEVDDASTNVYVK